MFTKRAYEWSVKISIQHSPTSVTHARRSASRPATPTPAPLYSVTARYYSPHFRPTVILAKLTFPNSKFANWLQSVNAISQMLGLSGLSAADSTCSPLCSCSTIFYHAPAPAHPIFGPSAPFSTLLTCCVYQWMARFMAVMVKRTFCLVLFVFFSFNDCNEIACSWNKCTTEKFHEINVINHNIMYTLIYKYNWINKY